MALLSFGLAPTLAVFGGLLGLYILVSNSLKNKILRENELDNNL